MYLLLCIVFLIAGLIKANVQVMGIAVLFAIADAIWDVSRKDKKD